VDPIAILRDRLTTEHSPAVTPQRQSCAKCVGLLLVTRIFYLNHFFGCFFFVFLVASSSLMTLLTIS
jgi:hypothetical protein